LKKAEVIVTHTTEATLIEWAHSMQPDRPRPEIGEAATYALEEFARDKREMRAKFAAAARKVEKQLG
jgi:hypothetical protein